jgi:cytochrome b involved in lipid metabolism
MGNSGSNRATIPAKMRKERNTIRAERVHQNVAKVDHYTEQWAREPQQITTTSSESLQQYKILSIARDQVQRGDRPLTKTDLTAILFRLQPNRFHPEDAARVYENLTSRDLIVLIREILYDPSTTISNRVSQPSSSNLLVKK